MDTLFRAVDEIEGAAESPDGLVYAVTDRFGQLRSLEIDPRIYHYRDVPGLASIILRTVWSAAHDADQLAFELLTPLLPPGATAEDTDTVFDPLLYQLDRQGDSTEIRDRVRRLRDGQGDLSGTASSADGLVTVVVNGRGCPAELDLDDLVYRAADSGALADSIVATAGRAVADLAHHGAAR